MINVAILFDGDYTRRTVKRRIGRNPSAIELEQFCRLCLYGDEKLIRAFYYDCPPFNEIRKLPITESEKNFGNDPVFQSAKQFQDDLVREDFFIFRKGSLSFDGWKIKEECIAEIKQRHRVLMDDDFEPVLTQKQVDMKIGLDIAKLSLGKIVKKILLVTADADFIPAIHFARGKGIEVILLSDGHSSLKIKGELIKSYNNHRIIP